MAQEGGLLYDFEPADAGPALIDLENGFDDVVDMALRIDPARNCEAQQLMPGAFAEHHGADLHGSDSSLPIEFDGQRLRRKLLPGNMRQHPGAIDVDGVAAGGFDDRDARVGDVAAEVV